MMVDLLGRFVLGGADVLDAGALLEGLERLVGDKPALLWPQGEALPLSRQVVARGGTHELVLTGHRSARFALPAYPRLRPMSALSYSVIAVQPDDGKTSSAEAVAFGLP